MRKIIFICCFLSAVNAQEKPVLQDYKTNTLEKHTTVKREAPKPLVGGAGVKKTSKANQIKHLTRH